MSHELPLTPANRLRLSEAFRHNPRVDCSIDCAVEGQMGLAYVDDLERPAAWRITVGPFWYFAGDADSPGGRALLAELPPYNMLMPSLPAWAAAARKTFGERLVTFPRYTFDAAGLTEAHLSAVLEASPHRDSVRRVDAALLARPDNYVEFDDFDSAEDFLERGVGYNLMEEGKLTGAAYSSLVCNRGIEVSLFVDEPYRRRGVATAISAALLLECVRRGLWPNWDAANLESCALAEKLGYTPAGSYESYYYPPAS
ncbi:MAG: GNAT family N-acetyltransferase [Candidatus Promineofilum sp.]|nr:GNAT family N-acetyltransferase [Promineifilum sp.]